MSLAPLLAAALLSHAAPGGDGEAGRPRPNVLLICADDLAPVLDDPGVVTPNLDRLRKRAVTFDRAYCQYPLCNPSRSSMLSGLRPDATGIYGNATRVREAVPGVVTLPQLFRENGYFTARVGKVYHYGNPGDIGTDSLDDPESWDRVVNPAGRDKAEEGLLIDYTPDRGTGSSLNWLDADGTDLEHTDGLVAVGTVALMTETLAKNPDRPWFLAAGFFRPHCPYAAPRPHFAPYPAGSVSVPPFDGRPAGVPEIAAQFTRPYPWFGVTKPQADAAKAGVPRLGHVPGRQRRPAAGRPRRRRADRSHRRRVLERPRLPPRREGPLDEAEPLRAVRQGPAGDRRAGPDGSE